MDDDMKNSFLQQHIDNYHKAIVDIVYNNTNVLIEDIMSIIGKPPLDSMDFIQNKFLDLAKKNKIVLNTEKLKVLLNHYRSQMKECCEEIQKIRVDTLTLKVDKFDFHKEDVLVFYKKDFVDLNKKIRNILKKHLSTSFENTILKDISSVFSEEVDQELQNRMIEEIMKYMNGNYQRQILESYDIKVLVKDTTLMNSVKEQGDRYLFTLKNSRLLNVE